MTQRAQVLHMLRVAPGRKVTGEQLIAAGVWRYTARIEELRKGKPHGPRYGIRTEDDPNSPLAVYRLVNDPACDVESSGRDRSPDDHRSSSPAVALSVTDGVEGGNGTARPSGALGRRSLPERPLNPYEFDLLDVA